MHTCDAALWSGMTIVKLVLCHTLIFLSTKTKGQREKVVCIAIQDKIFTQTILLLTSAMYS